MRSCVSDPSNRHAEGCRRADRPVRAIWPAGAPVFERNVSVDSAAHEQAAAGNRELLASAISDVRRQLIPRLALGLNLAVLCSEDLPLRSSQGARPPSFATLEYERACRGWPRAEVAEDFHSQVRVDAAALLIAGEWDSSNVTALGSESCDPILKSQVVMDRRKATFSLALTAASRR